MRKRYGLLPVIFFLCVAVVYLVYPSDEKQIRKIISDCNEAVVTEDIGKLMSSLSYNYSDDHGNGYIQIKKIVERVFRRMDDIEIERSIIKISFNEQTSQAELSVRVIVSEGDERGYIIGDAGEADRITLFFEKTANKWLITKVDGIYNQKK